MNSMLTLPPMNPYLLIGGLLSFVASGLHIACIIGGANWLRFFGAGEQLAQMAERGSWYPALVTLLIGGVLMVWGIYALVGAAIPSELGVPLTLPFLKWILAAITAVYMLRGAVPFMVGAFKPEIMVPFTIWSSLICLSYGLFHIIGLYQVWGRL